MTNRKKSLAAAVAAAALLMPLATTATAQAEPQAAKAPKAPRTVTAPGFLAPSDMPDGWGTEWQAGPVTKGDPEHPPFCMDKTLPAKRGTAWHRTYWTDLDTGASQVTVTMPTDAAARRLVADAKKAMVNCAADFLRETPGGAAAWDDYGKVTAEDGDAHVYGVHVAQEWGALSAFLYGVGRDGRTVTFVDWGQMGYLHELPVEDFKQTMAKAVNDLR